MLFSIIIPVYQVEEFLSDCMKSVLPLLKQDCEIILVIGNSTDQSNTMAKTYANLHQNMHVIAQNGSGLSNARNCGVAISKGEYLIYVDSDDLVDTSKLAMLMDAIRLSGDRADVYMSDYVQLFPSGHKRVLCQVGETPPHAGLKALPRILQEKKCFWNVWRYVYSKAFLKEHKIVFLENMTSEDVDYTTRVFMSNPRIEYWNKPYYFYRMGRLNSLMNVVSLKRVEDVTTVLKSSVILLENASGFQYSYVLQEQFRFEYLLNIALICEVAKEERKEALKAFSGWKFMLRSSHDIIIKANYVFIRLFGLTVTSHVLFGVKKIKRMLIRR